MNRRRKAVVLIALLATLFSAVSPALAAVILSGQPSALRQMLGLPGEQAATPDAVDHAHHAGHPAAGVADTASAGGSDEAPRHATHGIYCSFCLNPNAVTGLTPAPVSISFLSLAFDVAVPAADAGYLSRFVPLYHSRAPPAVL